MLAKISAFKVVSHMHAWTCAVLNKYCHFTNCLVYFPRLTHQYSRKGILAQMYMWYYWLYWKDCTICWYWSVPLNNGFSIIQKLHRSLPALKSQRTRRVNSNAKESLKMLLDWNLRLNMCEGRSPKCMYWNVSLIFILRRLTVSLFLCYRILNIILISIWEQLMI